MKTDFSQLRREEVEARITTMLLGEMPADEAAELMDFVSRHSELLRLHDELKRTISSLGCMKSVTPSAVMRNSQQRSPNWNPVNLTHNVRISVQEFALIRIELDRRHHLIDSFIS